MENKDAGTCSQDDRQDRQRRSRLAYYHRNKARESERRRRWRVSNLDKERARTKRYRQRHPMKAAANRMRRRARKANADAGDVDARWLEALRWTQGDRCLACKTSLRGGGELDHVIPIARGGLHARCNVAWLCRACNRAKGARPPAHFFHPADLWQMFRNWATTRQRLVIRDRVRGDEKGL